MNERKSNKKKIFSLFLIFFCVLFENYANYAIIYFMRSKEKGKYLFFDIECSNGYNICSFGYCIVSENMKILEKKDIVINPESKFILGTKGNRRIELAYPEEYFYKQDTFPSFYGKIKKLLSQSGYTIIGHSIASDIYFLAFACKRYHLQSIRMDGYDTQKIYKLYSNSPQVASLEKILTKLDVETYNLTFHKSSDDAHATFLVLKELCDRENKRLDELLSEYENCKVEGSNIISNVNTQKKYVGLFKLKKVSKNS